MILLNVLDKSRIIKLSGIMTCRGKVTAKKQNKTEMSYNGQHNVIMHIILLDLRNIR